ncbi:hypothetical protein SARC_04452 [Sphaeroforma arctica JP610]|uniref:Uncharacterized protein n=1 Tax=Sphaeroforma arctica JP610 TaxID=667725 RepID=A0A0L0G374_9EUKA|nr:hypothetical protein SARC_04452 [Sphaeroforma arctica JP610]KNC83291.1 hypothetical protein SARC_04452 [Sphaeroforma arctica JP610]|eukprot:XP_014157193.1 hypothetical protein SARC_04452 [Sphaeroforma arctica JP610]
MDTHTADLIIPPHDPQLEDAQIEPKQHDGHYNGRPRRDQISVVRLQVPRVHGVTWGGVTGFKGIHKVLPVPDKEVEYAGRQYEEKGDQERPPKLCGGAGGYGFSFE